MAVPRASTVCMAGRDALEIYILVYEGGRQGCTHASNRLVSSDNSFPVQWPASHPTLYDHRQSVASARCTVPTHPTVRWLPPPLQTGGSPCTIAPPHSCSPPYGGSPPPPVYRYTTHSWTRVILTNLKVTQGVHGTLTYLSQPPEQ